MMARTKPPRNSITTGSAIEDMMRAYGTSVPYCGSQKRPIPLLETVSREMTITRSEVLQFGMISKIHISAANTNRAITRCWTTVRASMP